MPNRPRRKAPARLNNDGTPADYTTRYPSTASNMRTLADKHRGQASALRMDLADREREVIAYLKAQKQLAADRAELAELGKINTQRVQRG